MPAPIAGKALLWVQPLAWSDHAGLEQMREIALLGLGKQFLHWPYSRDIVSQRIEISSPEQ
jgi:hypothetical protein